MCENDKPNPLELPFSSSPLTEEDLLSPTSDMLLGNLFQEHNLPTTDGLKLPPVSADNCAGPSSGPCVQLVPPDAKGNSNSQGKGKGPNKNRLSGAAKRRISWWMARGKTLEEAKSLCKTHLKDTPEYLAALKDSAKCQRAEKRPRQDGAPSSQEKPEKMAKLNASAAKPTFREVTGSVRMGLLDAAGPMPQAKIEVLRKAIMDLVDQEDDGKGPRFLGCTPRAGGLLITCADEVSKGWLVRCVRGLRPWEGASLSILDEQDMPKPRIGIAWVPENEPDQTKLIKRLRSQNQGMDLSSWRVIHRKVEAKGQTVTFAFDESSIGPLIDSACSLFLGWGKITVRVKPKAHEGATGKTEEGPVGDTSERLAALTVTPVKENPQVEPVASTSTAPTAPATAAQTAQTGRRGAEIGAASTRGTGSGPGPKRPTPRPRGGAKGGGASLQFSTQPSDRRQNPIRGNKRGRGAGVRPTRRPTQLPSLASEHSSKKAARNPLLHTLP